MDPVARVDKLEAELDALIRKRHAQRVAEEGERDEEAAWAESCKRYNELQIEERLWEHLLHVKAMRRSHTKVFAELDKEYSEKIERLEAMLGLTHEEVA